jgi:molybdate transport system regulatory protein
MQIRVKAWIELNGNVIFGEGRRRLLELVEETGSLNKAAKQMKMSYRAAWGKIKDTEERLGYRLLETRTGGTAGGGSTLTEKGKAIMEAFHAFENEVRAKADKEFRVRILENQMSLGPIK